MNHNVIVTIFADIHSDIPPPHRVKQFASDFQVWLSLVLGAVLMSSTALNSQFCQSQPSR